MTDQLRIGVVGLGMGRGQVQLFSDNPACDVRAVCDTDRNRLDAVASHFGIEQTYTDADQLFRSGDIDAVAIATPNNTHYPLVLGAFEAGLHVLCEKPLAMNAREGEEMLAAASEVDKVFAIHYNHRMSASAQLVQRYVDSGDMGEIYFIRSVWHRRKGIPAGADSWFSKKELAGGGCFIDLGVHMIDLALAFARFPKVRSVSGQLCTKFAEIDRPGQGMDVDDFGTAYLRCENGLCIAVEISWASHAADVGQRTEIYGTDGGVVRRGKDVEIMRREHGQLVNTYLPNAVKPDTDMPTVQDDFVDAVFNRHEPYCSARHGLEVMKILDAVRESSSAGREIVL